MLPEEIRKSLLDIKESIDSIEGYLARFLGERRDFNVYMQEKHLRRSVERELEIVGEATNRILKVVPDFPITYARKAQPRHPRLRQRQRRHHLGYRAQSSASPAQRSG
jgi:hypothetical protein